MKMLMLIAAVSLATVSAHASKARLNALQDAAHLDDIQEVFQSQPDQALNYEAATIEFGSATANQEAEGGFIRKMGDSAWGLYLGRSSTTYAEATGTAATAISAAGNAGTAVAAEVAALNSAFTQDNSLQLTYAAKAGELNWGVGLFYVGNDFKSGTAYTSGAESITAQKKQDVMGLLVGVNNGTWDAQLRQGLTGKTEFNNVTASTIGAIAVGSKAELNSTNSTLISGGYKLDTMYFYGAAEMSAGELKLNGTKAADSEATEFTVGVINSHKKDGVDFFYGASAVMNTTKEKVADTKTESTLVPLIVGVEAEVNSWMTLRGSLTQNLSLLSSSKPSGGSAGSVADSTTTALGAGFKWGKADIDTVIGTGTTGNFGLDNDTGENFAQMSVTYTF